MSRQRDHAPRRAPLTRDRVLEAAMNLADDQGLDGMSMRRLGQALGVEAMTLYHHVGRKDELVGALVDRVYAEIERPDPALDWRAAVRRSSISAHDVFRRHPWATTFVGGLESIGRHQLAYMDGLLQRLREAGFSPILTHHAYHVLDSHIVGSILWAAGYEQAARREPDMATRALSVLPLADYPAMAEHVEQHISGAAARGIPTFEFGLDLILDGLEGLLVTTTTTTT
ncbi:MAG: TetR/AcrR family transcriptional regulator [Chloroflexota bacterium]